MAMIKALPFGQPMEVHLQKLFPYADIYQVSQLNGVPRKVVANTILQISLNPQFHAHLTEHVP